MDLTLSVRLQATDYLRQNHFR